MAKVLSISSQVVYGHVGNSIAAFVFERMGHEVLALPTVLLSNRPGYKAIAGGPISPCELDSILEAMSANGWLTGINAICSGYIPTAEHAALCAAWVGRIKAKNPKALYLCDPIIGDKPAGIYIGEAAAVAVRDKLLPLSDILTPNSFELGWLSGRAIPDAAAAIDAARSLQCNAVLVTSAPAHVPRLLANIFVEGNETSATVSTQLTTQAHGTGDFFSSIFLAHKLNGYDNRRALQAATAAIGLVLDSSGGKTELAIVETQESWAKEDPVLVPLAAFP